MCKRSHVTLQQNDLTFESTAESCSRVVSARLRRNKKMTSCLFRGAVLAGKCNPLVPRTSDTGPNVNVASISRLGVNLSLTALTDRTA